MERIVFDQGSFQCLPSAAPVGFVRSEISVTDINVLADIGILPHEIGKSQPLLISVTLTVIPPSGDLFDTAFNYANIVAFANKLAATRIALIETFAARLAQACLDHPLVLESDVTVRKPNALQNCMAGARVTLRSVNRDRENIG
jgi:dihydroneopterin aldolase